MIGWIERIASEFGDSPSPSAIPASLFATAEAAGFPDERLPFDLMVSESHSAEFEIAEHAVEDGTRIADTIVPRLRRVRVTGMFTNHPVGGAGLYVDSDGNRRDRSPDRVKLDGRSAVTNTALSRWESLRKLAAERRTVRLVTALETYGEMAIESVSARRSGNDGESVTFDATLREIRTASLRGVRVEGIWDPQEPESMDRPEERAMSRKKTDGKVSAEEASAEEAGRRIAAATNGETYGG